MPNLGQFVDQGMTGVFWDSSLFSEVEREIIRCIFSSGGEMVEVNQEEKLDAITAISGSGPAYFFYLTDILTEKAQELGFSPAQAKKLAEMTCIGASAILENGENSAHEWINGVASKKGTTQAAIDFLSAHSFKQIFKEGVQQAYNKSKELAKT